MSRHDPLAAPSLVAECLAIVAPASEAFLSRWRLSTLRRIDPSLADLLEEQRSLYDAALVTGSDAECREQSAAMVRGWRAACARLETPLVPDDAYFTGFCPSTGTQVVIGWHPASTARVQTREGQASLNSIHVTPDEVARMMGGLNVLAACKSVFPDAEVIEVLPRELGAEVPF